MYVCMYVCGKKGRRGLLRCLPTDFHEIWHQGVINYFSEPLFFNFQNSEWGGIYPPKTPQKGGFSELAQAFLFTFNYVM